MWGRTPEVLKMTPRKKSPIFALRTKIEEIWPKKSLHEVKQPVCYLLMYDPCVRIRSFSAMSIHLIMYVFSSQSVRRAGVHVCTFVYVLRQM